MKNVAVEDVDIGRDDRKSPSSKLLSPFVPTKLPKSIIEMGVRNHRVASTMTSNDSSELSRMKVQRLD